LYIKKDNFINFFYSSRRRHTISKRDWSSDVCSSDLAGMVQDPMQSYIDNIEKNVDKDTLQHRRGRWTRSFIKGTFEQRNPDKDMDAGLMAAATINRDLLRPIQDTYEQWQDHIDNDGLDPINATILRLAVDGLWFSEIFDLASLEDDRRKRVLERLIQLTKED